MLPKPDAPKVRQSPFYTPIQGPFCGLFDTPRGGAALLGGLVTCGLCGRRMFTTYNENGREARYVCHQMATTFGAPRCQSISAHCVDAAIAAAMLQALSPSAIAVSLQVAEDLELERRQLHGQWKQRLERAAYETALARRRYESVDPGSRAQAASRTSNGESS